MPSEPASHQGGAGTRHSGRIPPQVRWADLQPDELRRELRALARGDSNVGSHRIPLPSIIRLEDGSISPHAKAYVVDRYYNGKAEWGAIAAELGSEIDYEAARRITYGINTMNMVELGNTQNRTTLGGRWGSGAKNEILQFSENNPQLESVEIARRLRMTSGSLAALKSNKPTTAATAAAPDAKRLGLIQGSLREEMTSLGKAAVVFGIGESSNPQAIAEICGIAVAKVYEAKKKPRNETMTRVIRTGPSRGEVTLTARGETTVLLEKFKSPDASASDIAAAHGLDSKVVEDLLSRHAAAIDHYRPMLARTASGPGGPASIADARSAERPPKQVRDTDHASEFDWNPGDKFQTREFGVDVEYVVTSRHDKNTPWALNAFARC